MKKKIKIKRIQIEVELRSKNSEHYLSRNPDAERLGASVAVQLRVLVPLCRERRKCRESATVHEAEVE